MLSSAFFYFSPYIVLSLHLWALSSLFSLCALTFLCNICHSSMTWCSESLRQLVFGSSLAQRTGGGAHALFSHLDHLLSCFLPRYRVSHLLLFFSVFLEYKDSSLASFFFHLFLYIWKKYNIKYYLLLCLFAPSHNVNHLLVSLFLFNPPNPSSFPLIIAVPLCCKLCDASKEQH